MHNTFPSFSFSPCERRLVYEEGAGKGAEGNQDSAEAKPKTEEQLGAEVDALFQKHGDDTTAATKEWIQQSLKSATDNQKEEKVLVDRHLKKLTKSELVNLKYELNTLKLNFNAENKLESVEFVQSEEDAGEGKGEGGDNKETPQLTINGQKVDTSKIERATSKLGETLKKFIEALMPLIKSLQKIVKDFQKMIEDVMADFKYDAEEVATGDKDIDRQIAKGDQLPVHYENTQAEIDQIETDLAAIPGGGTEDGKKKALQKELDTAKTKLDGVDKEIADNTGDDAYEKAEGLNKKRKFTADQMAAVSKRMKSLSAMYKRRKLLIERKRKIETIAKQKGVALDAAVAPKPNPAATNPPAGEEAPKDDEKPAEATEEEKKAALKRETIALMGVLDHHMIEKSWGLEHDEVKKVLKSFTDNLDTLPEEDRDALLRKAQFVETEDGPNLRNRFIFDTDNNIAHVIQYDVTTKQFKELPPDEEEEPEAEEPPRPEGADEEVDGGDEAAPPDEETTTEDTE